MIAGDKAFGDAPIGGTLGGVATGGWTVACVADEESASDRDIALEAVVDIVGAGGELEVVVVGAEGGAALEGVVVEAGLKDEAVGA